MQRKRFVFETLERRIHAKGPFINYARQKSCYLTPFYIPICTLFKNVYPLNTITSILAGMNKVSIEQIELFMTNEFTIYKITTIILEYFENANKLSARSDHVQFVNPTTRNPYLQHLSHLSAKIFNYSFTV